MLTSDNIISIKVNCGGAYMGCSEQILEMAKQNNGIITTSMVVNAGISRGSLKYLSDSGRLDNVSRGVYTLPEVFEDEFVTLQSRFRRGIFSRETALFLWDLTDRTPNRFSMTFPTGYNLKNAKEENILCTQSKEDFYNMGISSVKTPCGNYVQCYGMEKTLCDILRESARTDIQLVTEAFKRYMQRKDRNIPLLSEFSKLLKVESKVRAYMEVLL
jgi:predicted transcriptional regulator of viral defense system